MEMLMKILLSILGFFSALAIPFIGWVGISIVDLKVDVAETHGKVAANYENKGWTCSQKMVQRGLERCTHGEIVWQRQRK